MFKRLKSCQISEVIWRERARSRECVNVRPSSQDSALTQLRMGLGKDRNGLDDFGRDRCSSHGDRPAAKVAKLRQIEKQVRPLAHVRDKSKYVLR